MRIGQLKRRGTGEACGAGLAREGPLSGVMPVLGISGPHTEERRDGVLPREWIIAQQGNVSRTREDHRHRLYGTVPVSFSRLAPPGPNRYGGNSSRRGPDRPPNRAASARFRPTAPQQEVDAQDQGHEARRGQHCQEQPAANQQQVKEHSETDDQGHRHDHKDLAPAARGAISIHDEPHARRSEDGGQRSEVGGRRSEAPVMSMPGFLISDL